MVSAQMGYAQLMADTNAHIEVLIDADQPVELGDFVSAFTSIGNQYKRYMRQHHPYLNEDARVFVRDVRPGSTIAELLPSFASLISQMDQVIIVEQFVKIYGQRLACYFKAGGRAEEASKGELSDFVGSIAAIANTKNGTGYIQAISYVDEKRQVRASVKFDTSIARTAVKEIERHKEELDAKSSSDYERVLMVFKRSDIGDADVGVRSGERVIIESISEKDRALIYASKLAEERIKDQMRNTEENIFHKGFVVDVKCLNA